METMTPDAYKAVKRSQGEQWRDIRNAASPGLARQMDALEPRFAAASIAERRRILADLFAGKTKKRTNDDVAPANDDPADPDPGEDPDEDDPADPEDSDGDEDEDGDDDERGEGKGRKKRKKAEAGVVRAARRIAAGMRNSAAASGPISKAALDKSISRARNGVLRKALGIRRSMLADAGKLQDSKKPESGVMAKCKAIAAQMERARGGAE